MGSLVSVLEAELGTREPRGHELMRVSRDAALGDTRGDFDRLLELIYTETASCARRGLQNCALGFPQKKSVHGRIFHSDVDGLWDATVHDETLHRLLSSSSTQELLLSRLMEDSMHATIRSLSKSEAAHGERSQQWVSTTSHVILVAIRRCGMWPPTR